MKISTPLLALSLLLLGGACTQDKVLQQPKSYGSVNAKQQRRPNDKSSFRKEPPRTIGLGVDMNAKNPYKFRTVKSPKAYRYTKPVSARAPRGTSQ
ncbi:hypothetical protein [Solirubrum puertoriconensis]|uniref:Quinol oxidase subunit 4 n=1 Tax=Solirubrum puertoriconensis TaxID=1751427 RepID=A0A9X0HPR9_SOLP1|nr:hypothetical protein [Solirubrum puertoriconensis]KUG09808.1 hypothetical protein ASU33_19245 [Solirubrum puertoriconensis]